MEDTLAELALAAVFFLATHVGMSSTPIRAALVGVLSEKGFFAIYSLVTFATMGWMIVAYGRAPDLVLWEMGAPLRWLAFVVSLVSCLLLATGLSPHNPTLGPLVPETTTAAGPVGIFKVTRHPLMWAIGLWGLAHGAVRGDGASAILFGSFAVLALAGTALIDAKKKRLLGATWETYANGSSNVPFAAIMAGRARVGLGEIGYLRLVLGLVVFVVLVVGHEWAIGTSPLPQY
ncbi:MAG: NnrU family protein [Rhodospirillales bacterium]|nr:NnrU family protein [Rhodospirillales bacterium]